MRTEKKCKYNKICYYVKIPLPFVLYTLELPMWDWRVPCPGAGSRNPKIQSQTVTTRLAEWLSSGQEGKVARWTREPVTRRGTVCHLLTENEDCSSWNINIPFIIVVHICAGNCLTTTRLCMWLCQLLLEWESELNALYVLFVHSVLDNSNTFLCSFYTKRRSALAFEDKGIISTSRREITCNHRICTQIIEDMLICRLHRKLVNAWSIFLKFLGYLICSLLLLHQAHLFSVEIEIAIRTRDIYRQTNKKHKELRLSGMMQF